MIRLGFHVSIAGSVANAPRYAIERGFGTYQIFTTSSRMWKNSAIPEVERLEFARLNREHGIVPFAHIPYLCNIASPNPDVNAKSLDMLVNNIRNCEALGIDDLVIHLGSHLGKGIESGIANVITGLEVALEKTSSATVLLENTSGYKNCVGSRFNEIGRIIDSIGSKRLGVCFDTCHAFAAGYDMRTKADVDRLAEELLANIDRPRLRLVHLNDAKFELGSGLDRHWHIGEGNIGEAGFTNLFKNGLFGDGCFIMETPDPDGEHEQRNLATVKRLIEDATGKTL